jgi:hypothetical protein
MHYKNKKYPKGEYDKILGHILHPRLLLNTLIHVRYQHKVGRERNVFSSKREKGV